MCVYIILYIPLYHHVLWLKILTYYIKFHELLGFCDF